MNRDLIKSKWPRLSGKLRAKWGKLTYDDVNCGEGDRDYLIGRLQDRYGLKKEAAALQVALFERMIF